MEEVKSFFSFKIIPIEINSKNSINEKYNAVIIESDLEKKISLDNISIPKIFIQNNNQKKMIKNPFDIVFKLPLSVVQFNQAIIDLCKKHEFDKNSLIKIKDYILDKNVRVLKKNDTALKITEKEVIFLEMLYSSKKPLSRNYILKNIWEYSSETDTHTVETHIYRLRQKIKSHFNDTDFIKNSKEGYSL